jgi:hypothetical protein
MPVEHVATGDPACDDLQPQSCPDSWAIRVSSAAR